MDWLVAGALLPTRTIPNHATTASHVCAPFHILTPSFWQVHVKWWQEGSLISSGQFMGQIGGGIPCAILAAVGITTFLM